MANAQSTLKTVTTPTEIGDVTLTLSGPEARTLFGILNRVGGSPSDSPRGYADQIARALRDAGIITPFHYSDKQITGGISFRDGTKPIVESPPQ